MGSVRAFSVKTGTRDLVLGLRLRSHCLTSRYILSSGSSWHQRQNSNDYDKDYQDSGCQINIGLRKIQCPKLIPVALYNGSSTDSP